MSDGPPSAKLVMFTPRTRDFEQRVQALARDSQNIRWSQHSRDRMRERDISIRVALTVLREGRVMGAITAGQGQGEWKAKLVLQVRGKREVGVAAILVRDSHILVKTVEWEDVR